MKETLTTEREREKIKNLEQEVVSVRTENRKVAEENQKVAEENHKIKTEIIQVTNENIQIKAEIIEVKNENLLLKEKMALALYKRFGQLAEKFYAAQGNLFDFEDEKIVPFASGFATVSVFREENRQDSQKSYMWLARGGSPEKPVILYQYRPTRAACHILEFINGFSGFLQTDGYEGYNAALKQHQKTHPQDIIEHVGCLSHVRRKFYEASMVHKTSKSPEQALSYIRQIYRLEKLLRQQNLSNSDFLEQREKALLPLFEQFRQWLELKAEQTPPSTLIGKAVSYALGQWESVLAYLRCAHLTPDNNACERAIRPFVIGRKNWLFSGSPEGAASSCFLYSLIESAKENGLLPQEYLTHLFTKAPLCKSESAWHNLLPWNVTITPHSSQGSWI